MVLCIKDYIQHLIVSEVKCHLNGSYFGVSADEATDLSNWEQLRIVIAERYVKNSVPAEKLLEYVKFKDNKQNTIAQLIIDTFVKSGLDLPMC